MRWLRSMTTKDKRDSNIHVEPVQTQAIFQKTGGATLTMNGSVSYVVFDKEGNIKQRSDPEALEAEREHKSEQPKSALPQTVEYRFRDWPGNEDVPDLCQVYLQELTNIVADGIAKGFISG